LSDGVVILGGGLAGLSAAYHIGKGCEVFEAEDEPGGLVRTRWVDGFGFDYTGHLLHIRDDYARGLVRQLLKGNLLEHERRAAIYSKGVYTGYPFQANTYGLPDDVARECVEGFMAAPGRDPSGGRPGNFRDWVVYNFGEGIARHFMLPYNQKLWRYPLEEMSVAGIEPFVPVPDAGDVERGATREGATGLGYNPVFYYPDRGGIYSLIEAFARSVRDVSLGQRAVEVDPARKTVTFSTGYTAWYESLVSTIPLPELVGMIKDAPSHIVEAAGGLRYVSVYAVNLGVARPDVSPYHWVYFPEREFPFYRAGFLSNFSSNMAPEGATAMFAEVSHMPGSFIPPDKLLDDAVSGLTACGILRGADEVSVRDVVDMKYAYVVFDSHMERALPSIREYLSSVGIQSIGRYGAWEYSSMEDAILAGKAAADTAINGL